MTGRSSGVARLHASLAQGLDPRLADGMFDDPYAEDEGANEAGVGLTLEEILSYDGNIADLLDEDGEYGLKALGALVVAEYELDESARASWKMSAERALKAAAQEEPEKKTTPFKNAANIQYPLLTSAAIQFQARAYPSIVRGDEVCQTKINGKDDDGRKTARADRISAYINNQLCYECAEWEPGTDALLLALPIVGQAFRKVYWDGSLKRARLDFANAIDVVIPVDAPSLDLTPRVTQVVRKYPYECERLVRDGVWREGETTKDGADSQKQIVFLEQCRYCDLDRDGLSEPYIVTVHKETSAVVRIDPAFDFEDVAWREEIDEDSGAPTKVVASIQRLLPWVDYTFLPDPAGGAYGIGFGKLLDVLTQTINTLLNQMIDAGTWANSMTGFLGAGFKTRGGVIQLEPNKFKALDGVVDLREGLMRLDHPGPSAVQFSLIEFLLAAAKDITSVKDVLSGDAPAQQPATSTLALIEQAQQVFNSIYKRIYRSLKRELELLCRLNARYLTQEDYQRFLDEQAPVALGHNGGPPLTPEDMGGPQRMQAPMGPPASPPIDPREDFNLADMDVRPLADPSAVTEMQRLAKANFVAGFKDDPAANRMAALRYIFKAARIDAIDEILPENNPALAKQAQMMEAAGQADLQQKQALAQKTAQEAAAAQAAIAADQNRAAAEAEAKNRELAQKDRELDLKEREIAIAEDQFLLNADRAEQDRAFDAYKVDMAAADREVEIALHATKADREHEAREREAAARIQAAAPAPPSEPLEPRVMVKVDGREELTRGAEELARSAEEIRSTTAAQGDQLAQAVQALSALIDRVSAPPPPAPARKRKLTIRRGPDGRVSHAEEEFIDETPDASASTPEIAAGAAPIIAG